MKTYLLLLTVFIFTVAITAQEKIISDDFVKVAENLKFPEGPAWDGEGSFFVSNCYGDWITRITDEKADTFIVRPTDPYDFGKTNGLTFDKNGDLFACDYGNGSIIKFAKDGKCTAVIEGYDGKKFNRPNDLAFSPAGTLFFTDPNEYDPGNRDGRIFKLNVETGEIELLHENLAFPNGIAFSPEGKELYVCESAMHRVLKFEVLEGENLSKPEVFAELPGGDPDGIAFDRKGNLYIAHFGGEKIAVFNPEGKIIQELKTPGKKPSNVEFGGNDMKTLIITEDETNSVYKTKTKYEGVKLFSSPK
jgi:gluconolactonase